MWLIDRFVQHRDEAVRITAVRPTDIPLILTACTENLSRTERWGARCIDVLTDWKLSKKLTVGAQLAGFYLFCEGSVLDAAGGAPRTADFDSYRERRGIEGILLLVLPRFRGRGLARQLRRVPHAMDYDYVFGLHRSRAVMQLWMRSRRLLAEDDGVWITIEDLD